MIKVNGIEVTKGCTVKFRCGGEAAIADIKHHDIFFKNNGEAHRYTSKGLRGAELGETPLDIIEVIPPAFNWGDVKVGMAFLDMDKEVVWYAAPFYTQEKSHVIAFQARNSSDGTLAEPRGHFKDCLTRAPEHDLEDIT